MPTLTRCVTVLALTACVTSSPMPAAPAASVRNLDGFSEPVRASLDAALSGSKCLWVTDADKTLWADDIGEAFLRALIADGVLPGDVWATYEAKVREDKTRGYAWAVQVMAGLPESEVKERAAGFAPAFVERYGLPAMRGLVAEAKARGCEIWVVSASNQWIVEAGAPLMGLDPSRVIGIRVEVEDGKLTDRAVAPVTNAAGKVEAIRKIVGRRPVLVTGDSSGDFEMLAWAERPILIEIPGKTGPDYAAHAKAQGWLIQTFTPSGE